jgi:Ca2+-binding RTX toxin-like protein
LFSEEKGALVVRARLRVPLIVLVSSVLLLGVAAPVLAGYFVGTRGADDLRGTNSSDEMFGLRGDDDIRGRSGEDYIEGGPGDDKLFGEDRADEIYGGSGRDRVEGGQGNDYINVADDGRVDRVDCGSGTDTVVFDVRASSTAIDNISANCEDPQPVVAS